jgi:rsbT co-antagonist protein RsbR
MPLSATVQKALLEDETLLTSWIEQQFEETSEAGAVDRRQLEERSTEFLHLLQAASTSADDVNIEGEAWADVREAVTRMATLRAKQGVSAADIAVFVFALRRALIRCLSKVHDGRGDALLEDISDVTKMIDQLGLVAADAQYEVAANVIAQQQRDLLELSTPVIKLWQGVLAVPMIGTMDSHRALLATETLLNAVDQTGSRLAILDITGVPTVDTQVAQHLIKTAQALKLMGAECIISGISARIAQTMVQLGVDLGDIDTTASLADAIRLGFERSGLRVVPLEERP